MNRVLTIFGTGLAVTLLAACGGGNSPTMTQPPSANYDLQAGIKEMVVNGLNSNVDLSGTVTLSGVSTAFTGAGSFTRPAATSTTFNGTAALSQTTMVAGSIVTASGTTPYTTSVTDFFASSDGAFLGEASSSEYDVAQAPISFPTMVLGGSSGTLGTLSRYTDSTMSVSLGTAQVSYFVMAPVDPGSPIGVAVTTKIYDTQNMLTGTEVTNYTMTSTGVITFSGASAQDQSGTLTITPHLN